jgi:hypothetical protein
MLNMLSRVFILLCCLAIVVSAAPTPTLKQAVVKRGEALTIRAPEGKPSGYASHK